MSQEDTKGAEDQEPNTGRKPIARTLTRAELDAYYARQQSGNIPPQPVETLRPAKSLTLSSREATPFDSRIARVGARDLNGLYYKYLRLQSTAAELARHGKGIGRADRLMQLSNDERLTLSKMRAKASAAQESDEGDEPEDEGYFAESSYFARTDYIRTSEKQREIKAILLELGLTEMLLFGDWKVNREGGEREKIVSPVPAEGERRAEIMREAIGLRNAIDRKDKKAIEAKTNRIAELLGLKDAKASAAAVVLKELNKKNTGDKNDDTKDLDIAVESTLSDDITRSMGIVSFPEVERLILQFHRDNGLLATTAPIKEGKLAALDLGCGNGVTGERLRRDSTDAFKIGRRLLNYWIEIGFADKIYWTLSDLLYNLLRDEHKNDSTVLEFIEVVSKLLILRINNLKRHPQKQLNKDDKTILELATNPNVIRMILPNLERYIRRFKDLKIIRADGEFELDSEQVLSAECRGLIHDFFEGPELFRGGVESIFKPSKTGRKLATRAFLETYFRDEAVEHEDKVEKDIHDKVEEIDKVDKHYDATTEEIKPINQRIIALKEALKTQDLDEEERASIKDELADLTVKFNNLIQQRKKIRAQKSDLAKEKEEIEKRRQTNLAGEITIYPHNVILGDFAEFAKIMPDDKTFDWVRSWRASSHANDTQYAELMHECAKRLKPGGIITEDGKRESYTRFERMKQLEELQKNLGNRYRVSLIAKAKGPVGVLIERAIEKSDGEIVFFSDQKGGELMRDDASLIQVDVFAARWPEMAVRNEIIGRLKGLFIDSALQDCAPQDVRTRTYHGRMQFQHLHRAVDNCLEERLFKTEEWERLKRKNPDDAEFKQSIDRVWKVISKEIEYVRKRINIVANGAILSQGDNATVQAFAPRYPASTRVNEAIAENRTCKAQSLPRNLNVPDLSDTKLEEQRQNLVTTLKEIAQLTDGPSLRLHLYNCFTDPAMLDTVLTLLGANKDPEKRKLLEVVNVKIQGGHYPKSYDYPTQKHGVIDVFGGSTNDAYDPGGNRYIDEFMVPWLKRIEGGEAVRGLGICFGSQCMIEATGRLKNFDVTTERGALQFGPYPVVFGDRHITLEHLAGKACTGVFTRSGYSVPEDSETSRKYLRPLAHEGKMNENGVWLPDTALPPVAYSLLGGRAVTAQMHLETSLKDPRHIRHLIRHANKHSADLSKVFGPSLFFGDNPLMSPNYLKDHHFSLQAQSISGESTNWVAKDIGMAFLIPSLLHLATALLSELKRSRVSTPSGLQEPVR